MLKSISRVALLALMVTCSAALLPKAYADSDVGYVVFSFGEGHLPFFSPKHFNFYRLRFGRVDGTQTQEVTFHPPSLDPLERLLYAAPDYDGEIGCGVVEAISLAPGDYEISGFEFDKHDQYYRQTWENQHDLHLRFHVAAGVATYIGRFRMVGTTGKNIFRMKVADGGHLAVSDQASVDIPIARKKVPGMPEPTVSMVDTTSADPQDVTEDK